MKRLTAYVDDDGTLHYLDEKGEYHFLVGVDSPVPKDEDQHEAYWTHDEDGEPY